MSGIFAVSAFLALTVAWVDAGCSDFHCTSSASCWSVLFCGDCSFCGGSSSSGGQSSESGGQSSNISLGMGLGAFMVIAGVVSVCYYRHQKTLDHRRLLLDEDDVEASDDPDEREPELIEGMTCPAYWSNQNLDQDFDTREVVPQRVKKKIQDLLDETFKNKATRDRQKGSRMPSKLHLVKAQRIEDRRMFLDYEKAKRDIRQNRKSACTPAQTLGNGAVRPVKTMSAVEGFFESRMDADINEFYIWHGTSPQGALGISENGFRISMAGSNAGTMFGQGAYFAECCSKSDEYAKDGDDLYDGIYALLLCRVVCGEMFHVTRSDIPAIEEAMRSGMYDSVLGDREQSVGTYREFVVFREAQIYPEYVVLYERLYDEDKEEDEDDSDSS